MAYATFSTTLRRRPAGRPLRVAPAGEIGPAYSAEVARLRHCSRTGCGQPAVATLTFAYADSTAVVGPLATAAEPHSYDLCADHAVGLKAPRGWEVVRPEAEFDLSAPYADDLEALANAVREAGRGERAESTASASSPSTGRRGHLRVLRFPTDDAR